MGQEARFPSYYRQIEQELDRRGLDYEIHALPGADDIVHNEEYWLTNAPERTKLFPAIVDAEAAKDLDGTIARAVEAHSAQGDTAAYTVVLCGAGWTAERVEALQRNVSGRISSAMRLVMEPVEAFCRTNG